MSFLGLIMIVAGLLLMPLSVSAARELWLEWKEKKR